MAFFLLGQYPDGRLVLLSETAHDSRQDAMAALSALTGDPGFEHWDAEVTVHELSGGTPVLMVRPAAAAVAETPAEEPEVADQPADEPEAEEPEEPTAEPEPAEDAAEEPEAEEPEAAEAEPEEEPEAEEAEPEPAVEQPAEEPEDEALAAVIEDLSDDEPEAADEAETAPEPEAAAEEPEAPSLKDALRKTAEHMESQGIVAPESVGPADEAATEAVEPAEEPEPVADAEPASTEPEPAWPWATNEMPAVAVEPPVVADKPAGTVSVFDLDALEAPGDDEGSLVKAPGDDATMAAARPVIMGAYSEPAVPEPVPAAAPVPTPVPEPVEPPAHDPTSDFILDLEEIAAAGPVPAPAPEPATDMSELTCNDCVYVETCPNKGQLRPASCGSFQWK